MWIASILALAFATPNLVAFDEYGRAVKRLSALLDGHD